MADRARGGRRRAADRPPSRGGAAVLLGATSLGGALALTGILMTGTGVEPSPIPAPAAVIAAVPTTAPPAALAVPENGPPGPKEAALQDGELVSAPKAVAFIEAMRAAGVPTSRTGVAEVVVARQACTELASGTSEQELAGRIPRGLPTLTRAQAGELVDLAQEHYC